MTDKEVGELWNPLYRAKLAGQQSAYIRDCTELIRKLVDAEVAHLAQLQFDGKLSFEFKPISEALIKYGIDPETWSEK